MTATGLRRFIKPIPSSPPAAPPSARVAAPLPNNAASAAPSDGMASAASPGGAAGMVRSAERCEMCALQLPDTHTHLVDLTSRALMCCCRACYFLFEPEGAGGGRYRPVPQRYLHDPGFEISLAQWEELAIPVGMVFVFAQSGLEHPVAFYPSPAGATESLLPLDAWAQVMRANPAFGDVLPDVEAVLLRRDGERFDGYLVPIDACYDLVGRVRLRWKGFGGGEEVWQELASFFGELAQKAQDSGGVVR